MFVCLFLPCLPTTGFPPFPSAAQPSVLLREDPPPYSPLTSPESGSAPVIPCRVCQNAISVEGKIHQHVVKCAICNEATVGYTNKIVEFSTIQVAVTLKLLFPLCNWCVHSIIVIYFLLTRIHQGLTCDSQCILKADRGAGVGANRWTVSVIYIIGGKNILRDRHML